MNPILLKPSTETFSQVIVMGQVNNVVSTLPWMERKHYLWPIVREALHSLLLLALHQTDQNRQDQLQRNHVTESTSTLGRRDFRILRPRREPVQERIDAGKSACCVRCGGDWRRDYGGFYTGTKGETPATAKQLPTDYRASSRPYHARLLHSDRSSAAMSEMAMLR